MNKLKLLLKFWQEIVFLIPIGILIGGQMITMDFSAVFHFWFFHSMLLLVFICLIGQFYWKNLILGIFLALVLGLFSGYMILAAWSDLIKMTNTEEGYIKTMFALFLFTGLTIIAISMPFKYIVKSEKKDETCCAG